MEFVGKSGESGGGMFVVSILFSIERLMSLSSRTYTCVLYYLDTAWGLFLTRLSDLHRALANLARATLESVVQER